MNQLYIVSIALYGLQRCSVSQISEKGLRESGESKFCDLSKAAITSSGSLLCNFSIMPSKYVLGNLDSEIKRLEMQASFFEPLSIGALQNAGIGKGMRCIDIGCGSGSVTRAMAEIVGKRGRVTGLDSDEKYVDYCKSVNKHDNVDFVIDDISKSAMLDEGAFDIVFSRFLFVHLRNKRGAVRAMKKLLKKGATMVIQELDHSPGSWLCYPTDRNVEALRKAFVALLKKSGGDPLAGRKLYRLMVQESLTADVSCFSPCLRMGHEPYNSLGWRIMDSLKPQLLATGVLNKKEFTIMHESLRKLADRKDALVTYARFFSASGRK
jgi:2-polyprenyl-3-methyl-5-hydroxy-6-metoxy-1,4-benzoquinol methylase